MSKEEKELLDKTDRLIKERAEIDNEIKKLDKRIEEIENALKLKRLLDKVINP